MKRAAIIGAGVMGTAFAVPLIDCGLDVRLAGTHLDRDLIGAMRERRIHPRLNAPIDDKIQLFQDVELAAAFAAPVDLVVVGVSTPGIDWAIATLAAHMRGTPPVILLTKGIGQTTDRISVLPDYVEGQLKRLGVDHGPVGAIGGPCIAGELAMRHQTAAIVGFRDAALARNWADAIATPYYQLRSTGDLVGLEICAALKNFYAIGVGVPAGRAARHGAPNGAVFNNATAALFNQAVDELQRIVLVAGGDPKTACGLAGIGDLHVTCQAGRNNRLGRLMGEGLSYGEAMTGPLKGETVEGTLVAEALRKPLEHLVATGQLAHDDLPLARAIIGAVARGEALSPDWTLFHR